MRARQIRDECPIKTGLPFKDTRWPTLAIMNYWRKWAAAVGNVRYGIAITPDGTRAYVTNFTSNNVSVIDTSTNTVVATATVGSAPYGVAITPDGTRVYVSNTLSNNVSVIDTSTNTVMATVAVENGPRP